MYGDCQHDWPISLEEAMDDDSREEQLSVQCLLCGITLRQAFLDLADECFLRSLRCTMKA